MATKTISLELDAYEKLRRAKKGGESFSAVVRRANFDKAETLAALVNEAASGYGTSAGSVETTPEYWDRVDKNDRVALALESFDGASERQQARNRTWDKSTANKVAGTSRSWTRDELYDDRLGRK